MNRALLIAIGAWAAGGCILSSSPPAASSSAAPTLLVERARTSGDDLLSVLAPGPDVITEIDVARIRQNQTLGPAITTLSTVALSAELPWGLDLDAIETTDQLLIASYHVGTENAASLIIVRGQRAGDIGQGRRIDEQTVAVGPEHLLAQINPTQKQVSSDVSLLNLRARAMPKLARGAALRMTARLDFNARVELANQLGVDEAPSSFSLWSDVADDLAVIAVLGGKDANEAARLARAAQARREKLRNDTTLVSLGLKDLVERIQVTLQDEQANVIWVVPPSAFGQLARRLSRMGKPAR